MKQYNFLIAIVRRWGRKLICYEGTFEGFHHMLAQTESLMVEIFDAETEQLKMVRVYTSEDFEGLFSYNLQHIRGIFAAPTSLILLERTLPTEPQGLVAQTVRRPVEDLVLSAVMKQIPAVLFIS